MDSTLLVATLIGCVSLLYATTGQAGGTAFLAIMAFVAFPADEMRPTALLLNVLAAGYATWRLHQAGAIDYKLLLKVTIPSLVTAFAGGLLVLGAPVYFRSPDCCSSPRLPSLCSSGPPLRLGGFGFSRPLSPARPLVFFRE